jgi:hypothetical protein
MGLTSRGSPSENKKGYKSCSGRIHLSTAEYRFGITTDERGRPRTAVFLAPCEPVAVTVTRQAVQLPPPRKIWRMTRNEFVGGRPDSHQRALKWSAVRDEVEDFPRNVRAVSGGETAPDVRRAWSPALAG